MFIVLNNDLISGQSIFVNFTKIIIIQGNPLWLIVNFYVLVISVFKFDAY